MNVADYIASGVLEAYVLGSLSESKREEVELMIVKYPEVKSELEAIEVNFEKVAQSLAVQPGEKNRERIIADLKVSPPKTKKEASIRYIHSENTTSFTLKYAAAASVVLAIGASLLAFNYWQKWQAAEGRLTDLISQNQQYVANLNTVNQELKDLQDDVAIMNDLTFTQVVMEGTDNAPQALATVYWNEITEEVFLGIQQLETLNEDQQYQLWAIIDGQPINAGVFDSGTGDLLIPMKNIPVGAAAFAITIEPKGGSENPSLETMQVLGNV